MDSISNYSGHLAPITQNVVSTVNLDCKFDLKKIASKARNAEYNPKRFAAVIMRIRDPKTTALVFATGKLVCTGAKSERSSKLAARKFARILEKIGFRVGFKNFKIQNIVASVDTHFAISLERLACSDHQKFCKYEPEMFPGLIYKMVQPKLVILIFVSGKMVITGAKVRTETDEAFDKIYPVIQTFFKIPNQEKTSIAQEKSTQKTSDSNSSAVKRVNNPTQNSSAVNRVNNFTPNPSKSPTNSASVILINNSAPYPTQSPSNSAPIILVNNSAPYPTQSPSNSASVNRVTNSAPYPTQSPITSTSVNRGNNSVLYPGQSYGNNNSASYPTQSPCDLNNSVSVNCGNNSVFYPAQNYGNNSASYQAQNYAAHNFGNSGSYSVQSFSDVSCGNNSGSYLAERSLNAVNCGNSVSYPDQSLNGVYSGNSSDFYSAQSYGNNPGLSSRQSYSNNPGLYSVDQGYGRADMRSFQMNVAPNNGYYV